MISILIPTYNYNSAQLVKELQQQGEQLNVPYEIIVADDASTIDTSWMNEVGELAHVKLISLKENIGRSAIRNLLGREAEYPYLIFIDGDASIYSSDYLKNYISCLHPSRVIVGGTAYQCETTPRKYALRLTYGRKREANSAYNTYFTTFNFVIPKEIFKEIEFDTHIKGYGHEDFIFGLMLLTHHIQIVYITNPLLHDGLDESATFIEKTENANKNLLALYLQGEYPSLLKHSKLLQTYVRLKKWHLVRVTGKSFSLCRSLLYANLTSSHPLLFIFDIYKIGHLCNMSNV